MKILVTGANGQLGYDLCNELNKRGHECVGCDKEEFDITDSFQTKEYIASINPEAIIHCAAYTAVDKAEEDEELCRRVNAEGTRNIAEACKEIGAKMMYISTDYVFDGSGNEPWETDAVQAPINVYGQTKAEGEQAVQAALDRYFIVRISWVFGINGANFVKTMLRLGRERKSLNVVNDQIGSPTYTKDLSVLLADMIVTDKYGVYHASNEGYCSWYEFAHEIFRVSNIELELTAVSSDQFPTKAKRPFNSRMSKRKLDENGFNRLPEWKDALKRFLEESEK